MAHPGSSCPKQKTQKPPTACAGDQLGSLFYKTRLCISVTDGRPCPRPFSCKFAHSEAELRPLPDLSRTVMCKAIERGYACHNPYCTFAHSRQELRTSTVAHFKSRQCKFFHKGKCLDGENCRFLHAPFEASDSGGEQPNGGPSHEGPHPQEGHFNSAPGAPSSRRPMGPAVGPPPSGPAWAADAIPDFGWDAPLTLSLSLDLPSLPAALRRTSHSAESDIASEGQPHPQTEEGQTGRQNEGEQASDNSNTTLSCMETTHREMEDDRFALTKEAKVVHRSVPTVCPSACGALSAAAPTATGTGTGNGTFSASVDFLGQPPSSPPRLSRPSSASLKTTQPKCIELADTAAFPPLGTTQTQTASFPKNPLESRQTKPEQESQAMGGTEGSEENTTAAEPLTEEKQDDREAHEAQTGGEEGGVALPPGISNLLFMAAGRTPTDSDDNAITGRQTTFGSFCSPSPNAANGISNCHSDFSSENEEGRECRQTGERSRNSRERERRPSIGEGGERGVGRERRYNAREQASMRPRPSPRPHPHPHSHQRDNDPHDCPPPMMMMMMMNRHHPGGDIPPPHHQGSTAGPRQGPPHRSFPPSFDHPMHPPQGGPPFPGVPWWIAAQGGMMAPEGYNHMQRPRQHPNAPPPPQTPPEGPRHCGCPDERERGRPCGWTQGPEGHPPPPYPPMGNGNGNGPFNSPPPFPFGGPPGWTPDMMPNSLANANGWGEAIEAAAAAAVAHLGAWANPHGPPPASFHPFFRNLLLSQAPFSFPRGPQNNFNQFTEQNPHTRSKQPPTGSCEPCRQEDNQRHSKDPCGCSRGDGCQQTQNFAFPQRHSGPNTPPSYPSTQTDGGALPADPAALMSLTGFALPPSKQSMHTQGSRTQTSQRTAQRESDLPNSFGNKNGNQRAQPPPPPPAMNSPQTDTGDFSSGMPGPSVSGSCWAPLLRPLPCPCSCASCDKTDANPPQQHQGGESSKNRTEGCSQSEGAVAENSLGGVIREAHPFQQRESENSENASAAFGLGALSGWGSWAPPSSPLWGAGGKVLTPTRSQVQAGWSEGGPASVSLSGEGKEEEASSWGVEGQSKVQSSEEPPSFSKKVPEEEGGDGVQERGNCGGETEEDADPSLLSLKFSFEDFLCPLQSGQTQNSFSQTASKMNQEGGEEGGKLN